MSACNILYYVELGSQYTEMFILFYELYNGVIGTSLQASVRFMGEWVYKMYVMIHVLILHIIIIIHLYIMIKYSWGRIARSCDGGFCRFKSIREEKFRATKRF